MERLIKEEGNMKTIKKSNEDYIMGAVVYISLAVVFISSLYPFINMLAISFSDAGEVMKGNVVLWPIKFTTDSYVSILRDMNIYRAFFISVARTVIGILVSAVLTVMTAYLLSRRDFVLNKVISRYVIFTMYIGAGLIPAYLNIKALNLMGSFWVYIVPSAISAFNVILVRSYMDGLPASLTEAAQIDGANDLEILVKVITPLIKPVVFVIVLFVGVSQWNSWFDNYLYNAYSPQYNTLQYLLQQKLTEASANITNSGMATAGIDATAGLYTTPQTIRAAMTIVATVPILLLYPFVQKYFISGITVGAVKE